MMGRMLAVTAVHVQCVRFSTVVVKQSGKAPRQYMLTDQKPHSHSKLHGCTEEVVVVVWLAGTG